MEQWKPILGYEGLYEVSDHGRVKSLKRVVKVRNGVQPKTTINERILSASWGGKYLRVALCKNGTISQKSVHILVIETFVGPRPEGMDACHNDGDRSNNKLSNIRWDTRLANARDKHIHGTTLFGEKHPMTKLNDDNIRLIKILSKRNNLTVEQTARLMGVHVSAIYRIRSGKTWSHVIPYGWEE